MAVSVMLKQRMKFQDSPSYWFERGVLGLVLPRACAKFLAYIFVRVKVSNIANI